MNKDRIRAVFALFGSKSSNYSWQVKNIKLLSQMEHDQLYGIADVCLANDWKKIAIWRDNDFSRACAASLASNPSLTVVILDKKVPKDAEALEAGYLFQAVSDAGSIPWDEFDILFYSCYTDYCRAVLRQSIKREGRSWEGIHHVIYQAWCRQTGAYVQRENKSKKNKYRLLHLSMPSYDEVCAGHSKKIYPAKVTEDSADVLRLLFGYLEGEDFKTACRECLKQGSWVKKGKLVTVNDHKGTYFNLVNGERRNCYAKESCAHTIWLAGPCIVQGYYVEDQYTLSSLLQKKINADMEAAYKVRAFAVPTASILP